LLQEADKEQRHYLKMKNELKPRGAAAAPMDDVSTNDDLSDIELIAFPVACNLGNQVYSY